MSITDDATIRRTRLDGGATVVLGAIVWLPSLKKTVNLDSRRPYHRPPFAEFMVEFAHCQSRSSAIRNVPEKSIFLVLAEQLFTVFDKADDHHHGRTNKADEEHHLEDFHDK